MNANKPADTCPWEVRQCDWNPQWTTVGYILKGRTQGTFVPVHHWATRKDAEAHEMYLNRGFSREEAKAMTMALIQRDETPKDTLSRPEC